MAVKVNTVNQPEWKQDLLRIKAMMANMGGGKGYTCIGLLSYVLGAIDTISDHFKETNLKFSRATQELTESAAVLSSEVSKFVAKRKEAQSGTTDKMTVDEVKAFMKDFKDYYALAKAYKEQFYKADGKYADDTAKLWGKTAFDIFTCVDQMANTYVYTVGDPKTGTKYTLMDAVTKDMDVPTNLWTAMEGWRTDKSTSDNALNFWETGNGSSYGMKGSTTTLTNTGNDNNTTNSMEAQKIQTESSVAQEITKLNSALLDSIIKKNEN